MIKFQKNRILIESINFDKKENLNRFTSNAHQYKNMDSIEKNTHFQIYRETEGASKYPKRLLRTKYSEILVEYQNRHIGSRNGTLK